MKATILALFLVISLASGHFTPAWTSCEKSNDWEVSFIWLDAPPVAGKNSVWTICPKFINTVDIVQTHVTSGSLLDLNFNVVGKTSGGLGLDECFWIQFEIPQVTEEIKIHFDMKVKSRATDGCLDVTLNPKSGDFLAQNF